VGARLRPFNQTCRQAETRAPALFRARHLSAVGLMVETEKVQHAVQHQDFDFVFDVVAELARLGPGAAQGDGEIAQAGDGRSGGGMTDAWAGGRSGRWNGGKRKHVGGVIQTAKFAIQAAQFGIAGDEAIERLALGNFFLQAAGEKLHRAPAKIGWRAAESHGTAIG
jgi:hypothetical protein